MRATSLTLATALLVFASAAAAHETQQLLPAGLGSVRRPTDDTAGASGYLVVATLGPHEPKADDLRSLLRIGR